MPEAGFGTVSDQELTMLKAGSHLLPVLTGQNGRMMYDHQHQVDRDHINKPEYKAFLKTVQGNLNSLLDNIKWDLEPRTAQDPMTKTNVATALLGGLRGQTVIRAEEHSALMRSHTRFLNLTIETIRRELVSYGVTVSNASESAKLQRLQIASLAAYTADLVGRHAPTSTQKPDATTTT